MDLTTIQPSIDDMISQMQPSEPPEDYLKSKGVEHFCEIFGMQNETEKDRCMKILYSIDKMLVLHAKSRLLVSALAHKLQQDFKAPNRTIQRFLGRAGHEYTEGDVSKMLTVGAIVNAHPSLLNVRNFNKIYQLRNLDPDRLKEVASSGKINGTDLNGIRLADLKATVAPKVLPEHVSVIDVEAADVIDPADLRTKIARLKEHIQQATAYLGDDIPAEYRAIAVAVEALRSELEKLSKTG